ncbi:ADYC domain-containing protein [Nannocystis pusilla]|uniref:ADYC domain-containing protein n=1 Tax=Nannocystis pusilla TaxID=889268 RepID=UPI003BEFCFE8
MALKTGVVSGAVVLALGCIGCDEVEVEGEAVGFGEGVVSARNAVWNDFRMNDFRMNDFRMNGFKLEAAKLFSTDSTEWIEFYDFYTDDGDYVYNGQVVNSELKIDGGWLSGTDVVYTTFDFKVKQDGVTSWRYVWIKDADKVPGTDVWEYDLDLQIGAGPWTSLCLDPVGNPTRAILLNDVWDPVTGAKITPRPSKALTFACKSAALAKCVDFGYRPWASKNGVSLADYHQACTRMVRADYCGNGTPHTVSGTPIHVLDQLGIQNVDPNSAYVVEAEWGPNGAVCLNPSNTRLPNQTIGCNIPTCGASFASGGLIQSGKIVP